MNYYLRIVAIVFFAFLMSAIIALFIQKGSNNYHIHKNARLKEIFGKATKYDILFLGSSRMHTTINPGIVDSITLLKSYNAGVEGGNLYEFKLTLDGYLVNHPAPKLVVLSIDASSFDVERPIFFPLQYFNQINNPAVYHALKEQSDYKMLFIKYIPFLRVIYYDDYSRSLALKGLLGMNEISQNGLFEMNGFLSNGTNHIVDTEDKVIPKLVLKIEKKGIELLRSIIDTCRSRNIQLQFTYAPEYKHKLQNSCINFGYFINTVESMKGDIPFYRDDSLALCNNSYYFANTGHVNTMGSAIYSRIVAHRINQGLQSNLQ